MRKLDNDGKMVVILEDSSSNGTYLNGTLVCLNVFWSDYCRLEREHLRNSRMAMKSCSLKRLKGRSLSLRKSHSYSVSLLITL